MADVYVNLALLKAQITMAAGVIDRDDLLQVALDAAHEDIDAHCGRRFGLDATATARVYETAGRTVAEGNGELLLLDDIGSLTGLAVATGDGTTWTTLAGTAYRLVPDNALARGRAITGLLAPRGGWGWPTGLVQVTAKWGWPAVPARVKEATLIQAGRLYARRKSPEGVLGSADWGAVRVSRVDPDVAALLSRLTLAGLG